MFLLCSIADAIEQDPGPGLYLLPDKPSGVKQVRDRIVPMLKNTPSLARFLTGKEKDLQIESLNMTHMQIYLGWGGSLSSMSSNPMKRVWIDEARLLPLTIGNESNAIKLASDRLTTYTNLGLGQGYIVSSPSVEGDLLHHQLTVPGTTVLWWHTKCPSCGKYQLLTMKNLRRDITAKRGFCVCLHCNNEIPDINQKRDWNKHGIYAARNSIIYENGAIADASALSDSPLTDRMVFRWNSFVSPFRTFNLIQREYEQTKDKLHDYRNFFQCWLAEFWVDDISKTSSLKLIEKVKDYSRGDVPSFVKVITAGIDSQDDGFYVEFRGFGSGKMTALIDHVYIPCRLNTMAIEEIAQIFKREIFERVFMGANNERWGISLCAIDSGGHRTQEIYALCRYFDKLIAVHGRNSQNTTIIYSKEHNLYAVRTSEYLSETEEKCESDVLWWIPTGCEQDYFTQYCNVRKIRKRNKTTGNEVIDWKKVGQCDYRYASIHTFICLDIRTPLGTIRHELEKESFILNPYRTFREATKSEPAPATQYGPGSGYEIGEVNW